MKKRDLLTMDNYEASIFDVEGITDEVMDFLESSLDTLFEICEQIKQPL